MELKLLKRLTVLGVPGVAFGVFYLLLRKFDFRFESIPPILSASIAILFLLVVGGVTVFALHRWAPGPGPVVADPRNHDAIASKLSEWTRITYEVKTQWRRAMDGGSPWPGRHNDLVEKENALYSEILASLDASYPAEKQLVSDIKSFRELKDLATWSDRRDALLLELRSALGGGRKSGGA